MGQGKALVTDRYDLIKTKKEGNNSLRVQDIKAAILDADLCSQYLGMCQTGIETFIDAETGELVRGDVIPFAERVKLFKIFTDKVIPKSESVPENDSTAAKWSKVVESLSETKETP